MAYNSAYTGSQVDAAVGAVRQKETIWDGKQDELTGTEDQLVGFNSAGEATAVAKPTYTAADVGAMPAVSGGTTGQVLTKTEAGQEWQDAPDGLPSGGEEGQVLTKTASGAQWDDVPSDIPAGGTQGQVLTKGDGETVTWSDPASGLPAGGTPGQMLYQGESGAEWGDKPVMYVNITGDEDSGYQADKTFAAIQEAYQNKYAVFAIYQGGVFPLYQLVENAEVIFYQFAAAQTTSISVISDDSVYVDRYPAYASDISFTPGTTGLISTNVQDAIEEVNEKIPSAPKSVAVTLSSTGWSSNTQTVTVQGVKTSGQSVRISPATKTDADNWVAAGVWCSEPTTANQLVFTCDTAPTENININVELQEVQS